MSGIIRVSNIEKYIQQNVNGELILTPKKQYKRELNNAYVEDIRKDMDFRDIHLLLSIEMNKYEGEMLEYDWGDEKRDLCKKQIGKICTNIMAIQKFEKLVCEDNKCINGIIRISNVDKYIQEIVNGELILTPMKIYNKELNNAFVKDIKKNLDFCLIRNILEKELDKTENEMCKCPDNVYIINRAIKLRKYLTAMQKLFEI